LKGNQLEPNERLELKILALKEELSLRDDRIADLRVLSHELAQQVQAKDSEISTLRQQLEEANAVVQEDAGAEAPAADSDDAN
jgi:hypothetical protein